MNSLARRQLHTVAERSYEDAITILNSRRRKGRPTGEAKPSTGLPETSQPRDKADLRGKPSLNNMAEWLQVLGHSHSDIDKLNIVHVAGTKGKGSTCAFTESFLRTHGQRTGFPHKTGLYTSPHLKYPEERIRINFQPLARDVFAKYFFEVYETLESRCAAQGIQSGPRYLQLYALMAFHTFIREGVDAAIFETHHGGEYDATNVIPNPVVTAVTTLGMDHVQQLGPTIENIAWHKGGIYKPGAVAISSPQDPAPAGVLRERAREKGSELQIVSVLPDLPTSNIQLQPEVQQINCSVAIAATNAFLSKCSPVHADELTAEDISTAVGQFHWPGRFHFVDEGNFKWFADGAHNELSMSKAAQWFADAGMRVKSDSSVTRVLMFSQQSDQRDGGEVLQKLALCLPQYGIQFDHVIFTTYTQTPHSTKHSQVLKYVADTPTVPVPPEEYPRIWRDVESTAQIHTIPYIDEAIRLARSLCPEDNELHTLVTGSQHLVGGVLILIED